MKWVVANSYRQGLRVIESMDDPENWRWLRSRLDYRLDLYPVDDFHVIEGHGSRDTINTLRARYDATLRAKIAALQAQGMSKAEAEETAPRLVSVNRHERDAR